MVSMIVTRVVSLVLICPLWDDLPTSNTTLNNTETISKQTSPYAATTFLSIVVFDKFHDGVHVNGCNFLLALITQQKVHICLVVLEKVLGQHCRAVGVTANGKVLCNVLWIWYTAVALQPLLYGFTPKVLSKCLTEETRKQNDMLQDISEGLRPETQLRIRNLTGFAFDLTVEQVCRLIKRVREENHIADHEATAEKIRKSLQVIHNDRNARFDTFTFRGKPISEFCSPDWVEEVAQVVESEIYHEDGANNRRAYTNVKLAYDNIKTDFYQRLNSL